MKSKFIAATIVVLLSMGSAFGQTNRPEKEPATQLEAFLGKKGLLTVKDILAGKVIEAPKGDSAFLSIAAIAAYEPGKETQKIKGLQCSLYRPRPDGSSDSSQCFLDLDEAQSLSAALDFLTTQERKTKGRPMEEGLERQTFFHTKDGLQVGFTLSGQEGKTHPSVSLGDVSQFSILWDSTSSFIEMKDSVGKCLSWLKAQ